MKDYFSDIGWDHNTHSTIRIRGGGLMWGSVEQTGPVFNNSYQNFTMSFCEGKFR